MSQKEDFSDLQKLLRLKRLETPGQEYFDRFVDAFHTYQRREILQEEPWHAKLVEVLFESGRMRAICSAGILTTGYDFPALDCIAFLRSTLS